MIRYILPFIIACLCAASASAMSSERDGLVAQWNFDEGHGDVALDTSGHDGHATLHGATRIEQGEGYAIYLDGIDDYIDCASSKPLGITGPLTFEMWIKPTRKAHGMSGILGESLSSYLLTYYNTELCQLYIGSGGNSVRGNVTLHEWNHVVSSFDGQTLSMWINGKLVGRNPSSITNYKTEGKAVIGTDGQPNLPRFKGMIDDVRVYDRALSDEEALSHFLAEAANHEIDPNTLDRPKFTAHYYFDRGEVVVDADFLGLLPLQGVGRLDVSLVDAQQPEKVINTIKADESTIHYGFTRFGFAEVVMPIADLPEGEYLLRATLTDDHGAYPADEFTFSYPPEPDTLPSPTQKVVGDLPSEAEPTPFRFRMNHEGGFTIKLNRQSYPFQTRISWPQGNYNRLVAADRSGGDTEPTWRVEVRSVGKHQYEVAAKGDFYTLGRHVEVFPTHVYVKDTYTNTTDEDLGLLIYNETPLEPRQVVDSLLSGYERRGRQAELSYPDYGPSTFFTDADAGIGVIPIDDVFVVQALPYVDWQGAAGVGTEKFALAAGDSYTLEWAVYPTASKDYYDFVNAFRKAEGRIGTIDGVPAYITTTPHAPWRLEVVDRDYIDKRNMKYGLMHSVSETADDPNLHVEGIELFRDFPEEMSLIRQQVAETRAIAPDVRMLQHVAHSIYSTNRPEQFVDSRVIGPDGEPAMWGDGSAFGPQRQSEGWRWWIFYPAPDNSYHRAMLDSVDVMMDDVGLGGALMDGFLAGYGGMWTYDRWDGHSALINAATKTIAEKPGSVMLLSQPSMIEYARKVRDKGGAIVSLHSVLTRSITDEDFIIFSNESASGPELHLAPNAAVLGNHNGFRSEKYIYLDILSKLEWGELYIHYTDGRKLTHRSLASYQYPMTFEEIRPGLVRGPERIVTMNSGIYGWQGDRRLHVVYGFDSRGAPIVHDHVTTTDSASVRTELVFGEYESAIIVPIPVELEAEGATNVRIRRYAEGHLDATLNGVGDAIVRWSIDDDTPGVSAYYLVTTDGVAERVQSRDGLLAIPLTLRGQTRLNVEPVQ